MALMNRMLPDCTDATEADNGIHDLVISDVFSITSLFLKTISKRSAHRAKLCVEGIGGSATNKQKCKCRTFALLATFTFTAFRLRDIPFQKTFLICDLSSWQITTQE